MSVAQDSAFHPHAHQHCVHSALADAERLCAERGVRLTPLRRQVLALVWGSHQPLGAYALLDRLAELEGKRPAPPTVYRALEFLLEQRLIHRVASLNAYIGCTGPHEPHRAGFFICRVCGNAAEVDSSTLNAAIAASAQAAGFVIEQQTVELVGLCDRCLGQAG